MDVDFVVLIFLHAFCVSRRFAEASISLFLLSSSHYSCCQHLLVHALVAIL
jgi:hypothetical protein